MVFVEKRQKEQNWWLMSHVSRLLAHRYGLSNVLNGLLRPHDVAAEQVLSQPVCNLMFNSVNRNLTARPCLSCSWIEHFTFKSSQAHTLRCRPKKPLNPSFLALHLKMCTCLFLRDHVHYRGKRKRSPCLQICVCFLKDEAFDLLSLQSLLYQFSIHDTKITDQVASRANI